MLGEGKLDDPLVRVASSHLGNGQDVVSRMAESGHHAEIAALVSQKLPRCPSGRSRRRRKRPLLARPLE